MQQGQPVQSRYKDIWLWAEDLADNLFTALYGPPQKDVAATDAKPAEDGLPTGYERIAK